MQEEEGWSGGPESTTVDHQIDAAHSVARCCCPQNRCGRSIRVFVVIAVVIVSVVSQKEFFTVLLTALLPLLPLLLLLE